MPYLPTIFNVRIRSPVLTWIGCPLDGYWAGIGGAKMIMMSICGSSIRFDASLKEKDERVRILERENSELKAKLKMLPSAAV